MTTTIYLIRHGRTALNAAGALRGRIDVALDETGRAEALRLGTLFAPVPLDHVFSSPLERSLDTARAVAEPHAMQVIVDDAFVDRDYGPWAGRPQREVEARYGALDDAPADEIETRKQLERRVVAAIERIVVQAGSGRVAVVAHDAVNRALLHACLEGSHDSPARLPQPTGCWNRLVHDGRNVRCEVIGAVPDDGTLP